MKYSNPRNLALAVSSIIVGIFTVLCIIFSLVIFGEIHFLPLIIIDILLFVLIYFIYRFTLEKFIYEKIKLIYKTIHSLKVPEKDKDRKVKTDAIEDVNQEVFEWAEDRKQEVEELKRLETYRREFLGNVSHELKTPIFNIQGYVLTLLDGGLEDETINKEYLLRTEKSIDRMIAIVEDLEIISKLESGELKLEIQKFDIVALAKEVEESLEIKAKKKNIQLYFAENYENPIYVNVDRQNIGHVLTNLLDNSIKYGNENGKTKISFYDMDENILVEVTDNGIGIAKENLSRVFERFYTVNKSRSREQGGSGLGLSIVKHIIEAHNQTINVRSTVGIGTTFAFTLRKG